jgi:hypothetical protein
MDLTNDTCRRHFTLGQAARMQAMLRAHRPQLLTAAAAAGTGQQGGQQALALQDAWQSGLSPAATLQQQQLSAAAAAAVQQQQQEQQAAPAADSSSSGGSGSTEPYCFTDPWRQAALAADGQLSTALQDCACLGTDAGGRAFWIGQLNASYPVEAVRLLLPALLGANSSGNGGGSSNSAGGPAAAGLAPPAAGEGGEDVELEIRVGDSLDHQQNQRCMPSSGGGGGGGNGVLLQRQPLQEVRCQSALLGRYVTVALAAPAPAAAAAAAATAPAGAQLQQLLRRRQVCLCEVQPLTAVAPALPTAALLGGQPEAAAASQSSGAGTRWRPLPAVPLNATSAMQAKQSSRASSAADAAAALAQWPALPGGPLCSSTLSESAPWW